MSETQPAVATQWDFKHLVRMASLWDYEQVITNPLSAESMIHSLGAALNDALDAAAEVSEPKKSIPGFPALKVASAPSANKSINKTVLGEVKAFLLEVDAGDEQEALLAAIPTMFRQTVKSIAEKNHRDFEHNEVHYRIIERENTLGVACMQDFDYFDYEESRFVGGRRFVSAEDAVEAIELLIFVFSL